MNKLTNLSLFTLILTLLPGILPAVKDFSDKIAEAMPASVEAKKKYKLLVYSKHWGYEHPSIPTGKQMAQVMADKTGLFEVTFNDTHETFDKAYLSQFDGLLLNNTTHLERGIKDKKLRQNLIDYVKNGGGLFCIHSATDGGWKKYTEMINGNFDGHPWNAGGTWDICNEDCKHPFMKDFPMENYKLKDELYQYKDFDRSKVRVLASVNNKSVINDIVKGKKRKDNDYALCWIRPFGEGRIFVSAFGHNHSVFYDPVILKLWINGLKYIFKDIDVPEESIPKPEHPEVLREQHPDIVPKAVEESLKTFEFKDGYYLETVAYEPMVIEPVLSVFDGNGRMYVAEMHTYMQDIDGSGKFNKTSRVVRLEDTDNDGVMDKRTVFADNLLLPRIILPLDDRVVIGETNTLDLYIYRDKDGDGVADLRELWFEGGPRGGNLEHQPSGLIWSMDNYLYTTYNEFRLRFNGRKVEMDKKSSPNRGQWGLTQDNRGKVIFMNAGGEVGAVHFQFPTRYCFYRPPWEQRKENRIVYPTARYPDVQGGKKRLRDDNTLNHFTATCGQEVYRGDRLPKDLVGDLIYAEPVGRMVRRDRFHQDEQGKVTIKNVYDKSEFIRSTDANFRPVNFVNAPDGTMYMTDMYRGIIQEGNWVNRGSYLRDVVARMGFDKNIQRGRIFRLRHKDFKRGPQPRMLDEKPAQLLKHLSHPNGWWRDTAQKLIVISRDKSVISALEKMVMSEESPLGRLHALWTLEGLDAINKNLLKEKFSDEDSAVRAAAIMMSEPYIGKNPDIVSQIMDMAKDPAVDVRLQILLSLYYTKDFDGEKTYERFLHLNKSNKYFLDLDHYLRKGQHEEHEFNEKINKMSKHDQRLMRKGREVYATMCSSCHGAKGEGVPAGDTLLAPSFVSNERILGNKDIPAKVVLHGMMGPIDGKTYAGGVMAPMKSNDDFWLAGAITYIRNSWGNKGDSVSEGDIKRLRKSTKDQPGPYTYNDIKKMMKK